MKELKKHLSLTEQVALLESRGLVIADKQAAEELLYHVNYYLYKSQCKCFVKPFQRIIRQKLDCR